MVEPFLSQGNFEGALNVVKNLFEQRHFKFRTMHLEAAFLHHMLAIIHRRAGNATLSLQHANQALSVSRTISYEDDEFTVKCLNDVGLAHLQGNEFTDALNAFNEALRIMTEIDPKSPSLASILGNIGSAHEKSGNLAAAREPYERSYFQLMSTLGPDHPSTADAQTNLGLYQLYSGVSGNGLSHLENSSAFWGASNESSLSAAKSNFNLALSLYKSGNIPASLEAGKKSRWQLIKSLTEAHEDTAKAAALLNRIRTEKV